MAKKEEEKCPLCGGRKGHTDPHYPQSLGKKVDALRSIENPNVWERKAHGEAVLEAIRKLQIKELRDSYK